MGANRRLKAIEQFAWQNADIGAECLRCGGVAVFCNFEAVTHFRAKGWSISADDAIKRFRCQCGNRDVRVRTVPIHKRPRPIPPRSSALLTIYREDGGTLRQRRPLPLENQAAIDMALATLERAIDVRLYGCEAVPDAEISAAVSVLRPYCYDVALLDALKVELAKTGYELGAHADTVLVGIRRQLGNGG